MRISDWSSDVCSSDLRSYDEGGQQLPWTLLQAAFTCFNAANIGSIGYAFLTIGAANMIAAFGSPEQKRRFMQPMFEGRFFGTMCLSEPQAGSGLADIRTRATIGRASCRERVCQYGAISVVAVSVKKKKKR